MTRHWQGMNNQRSYKKIREKKNHHLEVSEQFDDEKDESALAGSLEDVPPTALLLTPPPQLAAENLCISPENHRHTAPDINTTLSNASYTHSKTIKSNHESSKSSHSNINYKMKLRCAVVTNCWYLFKNQVFLSCHKHPLPKTLLSYIY